MSEQKKIYSINIEVADMLNVRPNRVAVWLHRKNATTFYDCKQWNNSFMV